MLLLLLLFSFLYFVYDPFIYLQLTRNIYSCKKLLFCRGIKTEVKKLKMKTVLMINHCAHNQIVMIIKIPQKREKKVVMNLFQLEKNKVQNGYHFIYFVLFNFNFFHLRQYIRNLCNKKEKKYHYLYQNFI